MEFDNVKEFTEFLGVQRGLSPATVHQYKKDLRYYAAWLAAGGFAYISKQGNATC